MTPLDEKIPEKINRLSELVYNLWWSWTPEARELFRRLDYPLWRRTQHNPVQMLQEISTEGSGRKRRCLYPPIQQSDVDV